MAQYLHYKEKTMPHIRISQVSWELKNITLSSHKERTSIKIKKRENGKENQICLDLSQDYNSLNSGLKPADLNDEYLKLPAASLQLLLHTRAQISKMPHGKCKKSLWIRKNEGRFSTPAITTLTREACLSLSNFLIFFFNFKECLYLLHETSQNNSMNRVPLVCVLCHVKEFTYFSWQW